MAFSLTAQVKTLCDFYIPHAGRIYTCLKAAPSRRMFPTVQETIFE